MSTGSTITIVVGVGIFLILAGVVLVIINKLPSNRDHGRNATVRRGTTSITEYILILAGVACLITGAIVNGSPSATNAAAPSFSPTALATPATTGSSNAPTTAFSSKSNLTSDSPTASSVEAASFSSPKSGSQVEACQVFTGTSDLSPGKTLVLSVQNLSDSTKTLYLQPVHDWQSPNSLSHWTGNQFFGSNDSSVGQTFRVDLVIMDISQVTKSLALPSNHPTWGEDKLPTGSQVKEELSLIRIAGSGPKSC